jgi:hypothetical protein
MGSKIDIDKKTRLFWKTNTKKKVPLKMLHMLHQPDWFVPCPTFSAHKECFALVYKKPGGKGKLWGITFLLKNLRNCYNGVRMTDNFIDRK